MLEHICRDAALLSRSSWSAEAQGSGGGCARRAGTRRRVSMLLLGQCRVPEQGTAKSAFGAGARSSQVGSPQQAFLEEGQGCVRQSEASILLLPGLLHKPQAQPVTPRHTDSTDAGWAGKACHPSVSSTQCPLCQLSL